MAGASGRGSSQFFSLESNESMGSGCAAEAIDIGMKSLLRSLLLCCCVVPVADLRPGAGAAGRADPGQRDLDDGFLLKTTPSGNEVANGIVCSPLRNPNCLNRGFVACI
jgi:hypothetical protein